MGVVEVLVSRAADASAALSPQQKPSKWKYPKRWFKGAFVEL